MQVTGHSDPQAAAAAILSRPSTVTDWCVVKMGGQGALLMTKGGQVHHAPAFQVGARAQLLLIRQTHQVNRGCCSNSMLMTQSKARFVAPLLLHVLSW